MHGLLGKAKQNVCGAINSSDQNMTDKVVTWYKCTKFIVRTLIFVTLNYIGKLLLFCILYIGKVK